MFLSLFLACSHSYKTNIFFFFFRSIIFKIAFILYLMSQYLILLFIVRFGSALLNFFCKNRLISNLSFTLSIVH